jgi:hypothetical protein
MARPRVLDALPHAFWMASASRILDVAGLMRGFVERWQRVGRRVTQTTVCYFTDRAATGRVGSSLRRAEVSVRVDIAVPAAGISLEIGPIFFIGRTSVRQVVRSTRSGALLRALAFNGGHHGNPVLSALGDHLVRLHLHKCEAHLAGRYSLPAAFHSSGAVGI